MLNRQLLGKCEEFLDQIVNESRNEDLDFAIGSLRNFVEEELDGHTKISNQKFAYAVQCRLEEIWDLISVAEKKINSDLSDYFDELMAEIEEISEFQAERSSTFSDDSDDDEDDDFNDSEDAEEDEW